MAAIHKMIGRRIRSRRALLGLQQEDLAALTGIAQGHISRYERGDFTSIHPLKLRTLAKALKTSTDYLLGEGEVDALDEENPPAETVGALTS